jgi:hypothetical protein
MFRWQHKPGDGAHGRMENDLKPPTDARDDASAATAAPLEQLKESLYSDLEYVSLQVDGATYGGWYRVLPDQRIELLALANMNCAMRHESSVLEQARGMLMDFIRAAPPERQRHRSTATDDRIDDAAASSSCE